MTALAAQPHAGGRQAVMHAERSRTLINKSEQTRLSAPIFSAIHVNMACRATHMHPICMSICRMDMNGAAVDLAKIKPLFHKQSSCRIIFIRVTFKKRCRFVTE